MWEEKVPFPVTDIIIFDDQSYSTDWSISHQISRCNMSPTIIIIGSSFSLFLIVKQLQDLLCLNHAVEFMRKYDIADCLKNYPTCINIFVF